MIQIAKPLEDTIIYNACSLCIKIALGCLAFLDPCGGVVSPYQAVGDRAGDSSEHSTAKEKRFSFSCCVTQKKTHARL